jgi:hypothetical protein
MWNRKTICHYVVSLCHRLSTLFHWSTVQFSLKLTLCLYFSLALPFFCFGYSPFITLVLKDLSPATFPHVYQCDILINNFNSNKYLIRCNGTKYRNAYKDVPSNCPFSHLTTVAFKWVGNTFSVKYNKNTKKTPKKHSSPHIISDFEPKLTWIMCCSAIIRMVWNFISMAISSHPLGAKRGQVTI